MSYYPPLGEFQPPDGPTAEELAEMANTLPATPEEAYAEGRADQLQDDRRRLEVAQRLADALEQVLSQDLLRRELHYIDRGIGTAVQPGLSLIAARDAMAAWKEVNK